MSGTFILFLGFASAIFIAAASATRAYISSDNWLWVALSLFLYAAGNLVMIRIMREGGLGLAHLDLRNRTAYPGQRHRHGRLSGEDDQRPARRRGARHPGHGADDVAEQGGGRKMATAKASEKIVPVLTITAIIIVIWYVASILLNAPFQRDQDKRDDVVSRTTTDFILATWGTAQAHHAGTAPGGGSALQECLHREGDLCPQPRLSQLGDALLHAARLRHGHGAGA